MHNTMEEEYVVPDSLTLMLKEFARELLRAAPENMYEYGLKYFSEMVEKEDEKGKKGKMSSKLRIALKKEDEEESGRMKASRLVQIGSEAMNFTYAESLFLVCKLLDISDDMTVEYGLFESEILKTEYKFRDPTQSYAPESTVKGMKNNEIVSIFIKLCSQQDDSKSGNITMRQLRYVLDTFSVHLSKREVQMCLTDAYMEEEEVIEYEKFARERLHLILYLSDSILQK